MLSVTAIKSFILWVIVALMGAWWLEVELDLHLFYTWFMAINGLALLVFGKDKLAAIFNRGRTPEATFHLMGLAGGFPGIFLGRKLFNHKTTSAKFIGPMWFLFFLQLGAVAWYLSQTEALPDLTNGYAEEQLTPDDGYTADPTNPYYEIKR